MITKKITIGLGTLILLGGGAVTTVILLKNSDDNKNEINKKNIAVNKLTGSSFTINETERSSGQFTIKLKTGISLPEQVEFKYYKGTKSFPLENDYSKIAPNDLVNNDIVKIKFFIKSQSITDYKFPTNFKNPINVKIVSGSLKTIIADADKLVLKSFQLSGNEGSGKLSLMDNIVLPKQIEIKYYKGSKSIPIDSDYSIATPTGLSNNDIVKIKFFIKTSFNADYIFPVALQNPISYRISKLKTIVDGTKLIKNNFILDVDSNLGSMRIKSGIIFPEQVEVKYYSGQKETPADSEYNTTAPTKLKRGKNVKIKFFIKRKYAENYALPELSENPINFPINFLIS